MGDREETQDLSEPRAAVLDEPIVSSIERPATWRTSLSEPYAVDWIDLGLVPGLAEAEGAGGALGMGFAPGKYDTYWRHDRDLGTDLDALRGVHHVDTLVLLVEDGELSALRITDLPEAAKSVGLELLRYPIEDFGVPANPVAFELLIHDLLARIRAGQRLVIACKGGYGRTGTVAGVLLRAGGVDPAEAVSLVRATRPGTIENPSQAAYVETWPAR